MPSPEISAQSIIKRFGNGPDVLRDISFEAPAGSFTSFVGPSGCGKTTLLRILAGLMPQSSGKLAMDSPEPPELGFIFQDPTLLPWARVLQNITTPLRLRGIPKSRRDQIGLQLAEKVGLREALHKYPRQLSGGMQMRVSLARALSVDPNLLLLDEPFGALDAITRNRLNEELLQLHARHQWTAFFVTHSVNEAVFLSQRVMIMGTEPGTIHADIEIPLSFPRTAETRQSLEFQKLVAETSAYLHDVLK